MPLPHPLLAAGAAALVGAGSLVTTLQQDHGVPERAAVAYLAAARSAPCPVDYRILTAIGAAESGHGTHGGSHLDADGEATGSIVSYAGATGPMQFMPATWDSYGVDGDGDGRIDVNDIDDAAAGAAALLCADGVASDPEGAVYAYNHDDAYVADIDERAAALPAGDSAPPPAGSSSGSVPATTLPPDKGRICGVGEWLGDGGNCSDEAKAKAAHLWVALGRILGKGDTPRLHGVWEQLNGHPPATAQMVSAPAPAPAPALQGDLAGLPGSDGLQEGFARNLARLAHDAPGDVSITSGFRSTAEQVAIIESHGGECGMWVACVVDGVCKSMHCQGQAVDLAFGDGLTDQWVHVNMGRYQLCQPMDYEPWHLQPEETCKP